MRSSIISAIVASGLLVSATAVGARQSGPVPTRDGAEVENSDGLGGLLMIIGLIVVLLIIGGVVLLDDDDDMLPHSP
jgi:hypothetical protein